MFGVGAALGFAPRVTGQMTLFELMACIAGYNASRAGNQEDQPPDMSEAAVLEMLASHRAVVEG